jgi:hypothetical protein
LEGYLKWAKALRIIFYVGIAIDIAFLIFIIYSKDFSNLLPLGILVVLTIWSKSLSKKMKEIYYENPDAELIDIYALKYKSDKEEKRQKEEYKKQKKNIEKT